MRTPLIKFFKTSVSAVAIVFLLHGAANAQVQRRRDLPVVAESKAVERTTVGNATDMIAYVEDVRVSLKGSAFAITFYSQPGLVPTVETAPPRLAKTTTVGCFKMDNLRDRATRSRHKEPDL
jgi:hypothetical protein